jgi:ribosomal protein S27E
MGMPFDKGQLTGVAAGDGDRDGSPEVYFTGGQMGGIFQYTYYPEKGAWGSESLAQGGFAATAVVVGDGDDSGNTEVYVMGMSREPPRMRAAMYQFYNTGKGWERNLVGTSGSQGNDIAIGDGNNDSRTELFSADSDGHIYSYSSSGNSWNVLDVGNSTPGPRGEITPMIAVAVGDGDNDGWPEVYGSAGDGSVYRFASTGFGWAMTMVRQGEGAAPGPQPGPLPGSEMSALVIGDADGDGRNEVYGASSANASIYRFGFDPAAGGWAGSRLGSLGSGVSALGLAIGDGNTDGAAELYAGTSNNQVYKISYDAQNGVWHSAAVGSGNGAIIGVAEASATGDASQREVYAACLDGHAYQFVVDRTPPNNPAVKSDTHPVPGTWYSASIVHVLWSDIGNDVSGIDGYSYTWDQAPGTVTETVKDVDESVHDATSTALSPGKWYFHIRARDKALNWNATASHFGPVCIGTAPDTETPQISNIQVTGITDRLAVVSWSTNEPAQGVVEYGASASYGQRMADATFTLEHAITLSGLSASTAYHFRVSATDSSGNLANSEDKTFTTLATPDTSSPVISNVRVGGVSDRVAVISWETDEPADGAVEFGISQGYGLRAEAAGFVKLHELTLTGLNASTLYHFRVLSRDATGNGPAASADATFSTLALPDKTPPVLSNIRVEQVTAASAIVLWDTSEVSDSFVDYGPTAAYGRSSADSTNLLAHSVLLQGLEASTLYHFRALSADPSGNTGRGEDMTFKTTGGGGPADSTPPVISGVNVSGISDTRAVVIWSTDELSDSEVEYGTGQKYGQGATDQSDTLVHSVVLEGLKPMTTYHFRVKSTDVFGNGPSEGPDMTFTTAGAPDTAAPVISNIKVSGLTRTGATVTWTTNEPATSVLVYGNSTAYGLNITFKQHVVSHSVVISGLSAGKTYHFRVGAADPAGNTAQNSTDLVFTTRSGATTTAAPLSWLWIALGIFLVVVMAAGVGYYVYSVRNAPAAPGAPPDNLSAHPPAAGTGPVVNPSTAGSPGEDAETLQMDDGPAAAPAASEGGWEEEGAEQAEPQGPLPIALAAAPAITAPPPARAPVKHIRCPQCRSRIPIYTDGPSRIECPSCGTTGEYRPKGQGAGYGGQGSGTTTDIAAAAAARTTVVAAPRPGPVAPSQMPSAARPGPSAAGASSAPRMTRCSACGTPVPIFATSFPVKITCPGCGKAGIYRGPRS